MRLFTENIFAKLFSVLIASLLWVALVDEPELIETVTVPVEYRNLASNLDLSPDAPGQIQLQVRGSRSRLNDVSAERTNIVLDLKAMTQPSSRTFTIQETSINLPPTVTLLRSMPSQLRVKLERRLYKELPVKVEFESPLPSNIKVISTEIVPAVIKVVGPESRIKLATFISTEPVNLKDTSNDTGILKPFLVNVLLADPELSIVGSAQVTIRLQTTRLP